MTSRDVLKNVVDLSMSSVEVGVSTTRILSGTREVQGAATSMASAVEELSASIGEIESSARRSSLAAVESSELTGQGMSALSTLKREVLESGTVFETVSIKTKDLQGVVGSLGKVVDLITKIAGQTNLLALNATIEAARAGEHGRGFAVVAGEVKSLSQQTREATDTIQNQIQLLNDSFKDVLTSVSTAQVTVDSVIATTERVSGDFQQISQNSSSISSQVSELVGIISQQKLAVQLLAQNMHVVKGKGDVNLQAVNALSDQSDKCVTLIEEWRGNLANEDIDDKVVYLAQADHLLWKKRLLDMATGRSQLKSSDLTDHTSCRLGKWYYGKAPAGLKDTHDYKSIEQPHKDVHQHGIEAARCFERGRIDDGMAHYVLVDEASRKVIAALQALAARSTRV